MNTQNLSTLRVFQSFSRKCKSLFFQSCPKKFIMFLCEYIVNLPRGHLQNIKRHRVRKFQAEVRLFSVERIFWKQRRDVLTCEKRLQFTEVITSPVIHHLSWHKAVFPSLCFSVQQKQEFEYTGSYETRASKVSSWTKSQIPKWFAERENEQKFFTTADSIVDKILSCPVWSFQSRRVYYWMNWKLQCHYKTLLNNLVVNTQTFQTFTLL